MSIDEVERIGAVLGAPREGAAEDFFDAVRESGALTRGIDVGEATSAVMCELCARLDLEQARQLLDSLPPAVVARVGRCPTHAGANGDTFGAAEFRRRIAEHLQVEEDAARPMLSAVFRALRAQLPSHVVHMVERQLPGDLQDAWRGGART
jgi:uncharacterized protein (DUF2267 family)